jgi:hypothetical protein
VFEKHVDYVRSDIRKDITLSNRFDPTIPWAQLPIEEVKALQTADFGKIRVINNEKKK